MSEKPRSHSAAQIREALAQRRRLFRRSLDDLDIEQYSKRRWREIINNAKKKERK